MCSSDLLTVTENGGDAVQVLPCLGERAPDFGLELARGLVGVHGVEQLLVVVGSPALDHGVVALVVVGEAVGLHLLDLGDHRLDVLGAHVASFLLGDA